MSRGLLVATVLLAWFGTAQAYELLRVNNNPCAHGDQNLFWSSASAAVSVGALSPHYQALATEAWERWNGVLSRFRFHAGSGSPCTSDGVATIAIADQPCGVGAFGDAVAITRSIWNGDGSLVDADVTFESDTFVLEDDGVFRQVAMHELGHVLGLAHSDACGQSGAGTLMKAVLSVPPVLQAPQSDDIAGADAVYPGGGTGSSGDGTVPNGANSCAVQRSGRGDTSAWPLLAGALLLLWRRRQCGN